jgi:hypothetical protein
MIVQLKLSYEYSTTLIFQKNISKMDWKLLFKQVVYGFQHFCIKTTHNFERINIITPNYVYYKIVKLTLRYEYHRTLIFHKT